MGRFRTWWCEAFHTRSSWPMTLPAKPGQARGRAEQECFDCGRGWVSEVLDATPAGRARIRWRAFWRRATEP